MIRQYHLQYIFLYKNKKHLEISMAILFKQLFSMEYYIMVKVKVVDFMPIESDEEKLQTEETKEETK